MIYGCFGWQLEDPGPCPVDDTPHTACTPESVLRLTLIRAGPPPPLHVRVALPPSLAQQLPPPEPPPPATFTTATYQRALHGPTRRPGPVTKRPERR